MSLAAIDRKQLLLRSMGEYLAMGNVCPSGC